MPLPMLGLFIGTMKMNNSKVQKTIDAFNQLVSIGDTVEFTEIMGRTRSEQFKTKSEAYEMCGSAVVQLEGKRGCVDIEHCRLVAS